MQHSTHRRSGRVRCGVAGTGIGLLVLALLYAPDLAGQELALERELPPRPTVEPCLVRGAESPSPSQEDRRRAEALAQDAVQAQILGERERARTLLTGAASLDPTSPSIQFQLGRALEGLGEPQAALQAFCRYRDLTPGGPNEEEVVAAIARLAPVPEDSIPEAARAAFQDGVELYDAAQYEGAAREFSRALVENPDWALAHFNRAVAYIQEGRSSAGQADLERYLELRPGADGEAIRAQLARLEALSSRYSPGIALGVGLVVPGMGHVYSGRPGMGTVYLLGAGASVAAGLFYKEVEVVCALGGAVDRCPPEFVAEERERRPLMAAGLAGAGAITLIGAIHAYISARGQGAGAATAAALQASPSPLRVSFPAVSFPAMGREDVETALFLDPFLDRGAAGVQAALRIRF